MTTIQEKLIDKLEKNSPADSMIDFLKNLSKKEKEELVPTVKKMYKKYNKYVPYGKKDKWGYRQSKIVGTKAQLTGIEYAGFFCMNEKDFSKIYSFGLPEFLYRVDLHKLYSPKWLSSFVNNPNNRIDADYNQLIKLYKHGYLELNSALIVDKLPLILREDLSVPFYKSTYSDKFLYSHPITLKEHIWYLFTEESNINWSDGWTPENDKTGRWKKTFSQLSEKGEIDRMRLLKACLLTSTQNFNKTLSGWYFDLLTYLNPSTEELLLLQDELMLVLNCPNSKPINVCLKYIKSLCLQDEFKVNDFIETAPILLTSEIKSVVNSTLMILDKLAKKHPDLQLHICETATNAFLHKDQKIQARAAKIIQKYGDQKSTTLLDQISIYHTELYNETKELLSEFDVSELVESNLLEEHFEVEKLIKIKDENIIEEITTAEDLIFFFAQVFENNEDYHFDLFLHYLPHLFLKITNETFDQLEPIFQRAYKTIKNRSQRVGLIEEYMAFIFCQTIKLLMDKFTKRKSFETIYKDCLDKKIFTNNLEDNYTWVFKLFTEKLVTHEIQYDYRPFVSRLLFTQNQCEQKTALPMLATPTHAPCWLTFDKFIDRLAIYQKQNQTFNLYDFQIAIARVVLKNEASYKQKIESTLKGELKNLLLYLINAIDLDFKLCETPSLWLMVVYRKADKKELAQFLEKFDNYDYSHFLLEKITWSVNIVEREITQYNYKLKKNEKKIVKDEYLQLKDEREPKKISDRVLKKLNTEGKLLQCIYHDYAKQSRFIYVYPHDDKKIVYLSPHQPQLLLKSNIKRYLKNIEWTEADQDRSTNNYLNTLFAIWDKNMSEITYLQLACSLFYPKKPSRQLAAELCIKTIGQNTMNSKLLGECLGKLSYNEYAPLKRLTDLMEAQLNNISIEHNKNLEETITSMIPKMNDKPIKGTRKLLEIYTHLLQTNKSKPSPKILDKLEKWKEVASLKKVIKSI